MRISNDSLALVGTAIALRAANKDDARRREQQELYPGLPWVRTTPAQRANLTALRGRLKALRRLSLPRAEVEAAFHLLTRDSPDPAMRELLGI